MKINLKMKRSLAAGVILTLLFAAGGFGALAFDSPGKTPATVVSAAPLVPANFSDLAKAVKPGVVNISTVKTMKGDGPVFRHFFGGPFKDRDPFRDFFGPFPRGGEDRGFKERSLGSGFILDREGYIVTNNHVVDGADEIRVKLADGREFDAAVVGRDANTDIALIRIEGGSDLSPLPLGNSDGLDVGHWVVAVGSPFGLEQTVTAGIVSAKGRVIGAGPYDDFIQTDASINPGNSGGPLLNLKGEVVGINTAIIANGHGIGFAIPVNLAKDVISQLKTNGTVTRGWLGVAIQDLTPEIAGYYGVQNQKGALVAEVFPGEPAEKAGLKARDIIISVDGKDVSTSRELSKAIASISVGKKATLRIYRDGRPVTATVEIGKRPERETASAVKPADRESLGLTIGDLTPGLARQMGLDGGARGVVIIEVAPESPADRAGFRERDLILEVNRKPVNGTVEFKEEMSRSGKGEPVQVLVKRAGAGLVVISFER